MFEELNAPTEPLLSSAAAAALADCIWVSEGFIVAYFASAAALARGGSQERAPHIVLHRICNKQKLQL
jgi:hypothetical protein